MNKDDTIAATVDQDEFEASLTELVQRKLTSSEWSVFSIAGDAALKPIAEFPSFTTDRAVGAKRGKMQKHTTKSIEKPAPDAQKATWTPEPELRQAVVSRLRALVQELAANRAARVAAHQNQIPAAKRQPISLLPLDGKDEALLLDFALVVGTIERGACYHAVKQYVNAETAEKIGAEMSKRGPMTFRINGSMTYVFDDSKLQWAQARACADTEVALVK